MLAILYVVLVAVLAYQVRNRIALLEGFTGFYRYLFSLGLTLFLATWANFLLYVSFGWGEVRLAASWAVVLVPIACLSYAQDLPSPESPSRPLRARLVDLLRQKWDYWCLFAFLVVLVRFYSGLDFDENDNFWSLYNFDDTPFHLSVANAFLNSPRFPPMDLDMPPYPLKYHFMADFWLAHLQRLGTRAVYTVFGMNCIGGLILAGALWAAFKKWLNVHSRWVLLACVVFLFLNTAIINVIHYLWFRPVYFHPDKLFDGLLAFPYFNFESQLLNMFSPQRGLLFVFPIGLLVLDAVFGAAAGPGSGREPASAHIRILQASVLVCLMPFTHVVTFAVLACCLVPAIWEHRRWLAGRYWVWIPALTLAGLQLFYFSGYGPPPHPDYSSWDVASALPLQEIASVPAVLRRALFWFFIDGDFLFWGCLFAALALFPWSRLGMESPPLPALRAFLGRWRWYFAVCALFFAGVNFYRYSFSWGDSNKFVLFLNFGMTMVIVLGAAQLMAGRGRIISHAIWIFLFVLCIAPPAYRFAASVISEPYGSVLLFNANERAAARWLRQSTKPSDHVLTGAYGSIHFVSSLAGRPVLAGLYGESNYHRQDEREDLIRRVYEEADWDALRKLNPRYVVICRYERTFYRLNPVWQDFINHRRAVVFQAGASDEAHSVEIFDRLALPGQAGAGAPERAAPIAPARTGASGG